MVLTDKYLKMKIAEKLFCAKLLFSRVMMHAFLLVHVQPESLILQPLLIGTVLLHSHFISNMSQSCDVEMGVEILGGNEGWGNRDKSHRLVGGKHKRLNTVQKKLRWDWAVQAHCLGSYSSDYVQWCWINKHLDVEASPLVYVTLHFPVV